MTERSKRTDEYSPEGYPKNQKALAEQAKKRLDAEASLAKRGERLLRRLAKILGSTWGHK